MKRLIRSVLWTSPFWGALWLVWMLQSPHSASSVVVFAILAAMLVLTLIADLTED